MTDYDNNMQVIMSKVVSDKSNAPALRVNLEIDGVKYKAGLWVWTKRDGTKVTDKNNNAQYKGTLEVDDYKPNQQSTPPSTPQDDFDDDIPF